MYVHVTSSTNNKQTINLPNNKIAIIHEHACMSVYLTRWRDRSGPASPPCPPLALPGRGSGCAGLGPVPQRREARGSDHPACIAGHRVMRGWLRCQGHQPSTWWPQCPEYEAQIPARERTEEQINIRESVDSVYRDGADTPYTLML